MDSGGFLAPHCTPASSSKPPPCGNCCTPTGPMTRGGIARNCRHATSCAKTLQDAPGEWKTHEHNKDRRNSDLCAERPNFEIDVPADWNVQRSDCDFVGFVSGNGSAELQAVVTDLPDFPEDVRAALDEMQSRWVRDVSDADGSVKRVQRQMLPIITSMYWASRPNPGLRTESAP